MQKGSMHERRQWTRPSGRHYRAKVASYNKPAKVVQEALQVKEQQDSIQLAVDSRVSPKWLKGHSFDGLLTSESIRALVLQAFLVAQDVNLQQPSLNISRDPARDWDNIGAAFGEHAIDGSVVARIGTTAELGQQAAAAAQIPTESIFGPARPGSVSS